MYDDATKQHAAPQRPSPNGQRASTMEITMLDGAVEYCLRIIFGATCCSTLVWFTSKPLALRNTSLECNSSLRATVVEYSQLILYLDFAVYRQKRCEYYGYTNTLSLIAVSILAEAMIVTPARSPAVTDP
jgi:hypothetical protein